MTLDGIATTSAIETALAGIDLSLDTLTARVGDRELHADNRSELQQEISTVLYTDWHAGHAAGEGVHPKNARSRDFEERLRAATGHTTTRVTGVVREPAVAGVPSPAGALLVEREGIRVWVPTAALDPQTADPAPGDPVTFSIAAVRPALSPGFLLADGSRGNELSDHVLRVYLHLVDPLAAVDVWATTVRCLEAAGARYRTKVLSGPRLYPRRDALVVYLPPRHWDLVPQLVRTVRSRPGTGEDTSLLARRLAPGVAMAFEPRDPDPTRRGLSFGQHRASVLARAVVLAAENGDDIRETAERLCVEAGVDPHEPYRNTDSPSVPFDPADL